LFTPLVFLPIAAAEWRPGDDARARLLLADPEVRRRSAERRNGRR